MSELVLGGNKFNVEPLDAWSTFELQQKIAPAVAEVIGVLGPALAAEDPGKIDLGGVSSVVGRFFSHFGKGELKQLVRELLANATMDGTALFSAQGDTFTVKMQGRTLDTWRLLWHAVQVNYPDFFSMLAAAVQKRAEKASASKESTT